MPAGEGPISDGASRANHRPGVKHVRTPREQPPLGDLKKSSRGLGLPGDRWRFLGAAFSEGESESETDFGIADPGHRLRHRGMVGAAA